MLPSYYRPGGRLDEDGGGGVGAGGGSFLSSQMLRLANRKVYKRYQHLCRTCFLNGTLRAILVGIAVVLGIFLVSVYMLSSSDSGRIALDPVERERLAQQLRVAAVPVIPLHDTGASQAQAATEEPAAPVRVRTVPPAPPVAGGAPARGHGNPPIVIPTRAAASGAGDGTSADQHRRQEAVKKAMQHAWAGYERHAFGHDEVRPVSNRTNDSWNGWGVTLVDALDTLWLMGLKAEFQRAVDHVATIKFNQNRRISVFETTIRYLGGLLSAYALSKEPILLAQATELGDLLMPAFNSPSGLPYHEVNLVTGEGGNPTWNGNAFILAEVGSVQLEFKYLSKATGNPAYAAAAQKAMDYLDAIPKALPGLYPVHVSGTAKQFTTDHVTLGALADSFYEYELKQYLLTGKTEDQFRRMYVESVEGVRAHLLGQSGSTVYLGELRNGRLSGVMDHLVCFVPGMLALGATELDRPKDLELAEQLASTCYRLYSESPTGIGPEIVTFGHDGKYTVNSGKYLLRPETIESLYVLYRQTGDRKYQDWGWAIFQAIERHCRTPTAYSGLQDVGQVPPVQNDSMQSFFLAETLKYLYLLFSPPSVLPQAEYVFNTEAHPLPIFAANERDL